MDKASATETAGLGSIPRQVQNGNSITLLDVQHLIGKWARRSLTKDCRPGPGQFAITYKTPGSDMQ